jgi:beta-phosphoglucomutase-like phosphatase (HAD superfamily)/tRNA(Arg) A34 adenosine deaminase TadA
MALDAIIFDLDGTLVDTNGLHVEAWRRAFEGHGYRVHVDRIWREVGKGGDQLVPAILGDEAERAHGEGLREAWVESFLRLSRETKIGCLRGALDLVEAAKRRGLRLILATSSKNGTFEATVRSCGVDFRELIPIMVSGDDADATKPAPDLVLAAVRKLDLSPAQCAMIGDTPYDAEACRHGGVVCIGLTTGGIDADMLIRAGARMTYRDAADLLEHFDDALHRASPGPAHLTHDALARLMREALATAEDGLRAGEAPIGCVLARGDGTIIARGYNEMNATQNKAAHAEIITFARAAGKVPLDAQDLILVSTLEPCVMCTGAAMEAAVDTIVYGLRAPADSGTGRVMPPQSPESQMPRIVGDVLAEESRALFERWLGHNADSPQAAYVKQLLALAP